MPDLAARVQVLQAFTDFEELKHQVELFDAYSDESDGEFKDPAAALRALGLSVDEATRIANGAFASPLRALAPLLLRREDPAPVEIVVEQRRRQRVASQKCRQVLRDGIDRTTRDIDAFRTQKTAAPWLMRPTGTAIEECVFCATNCVMLGPGLEKEKP